MPTPWKATPEQEREQALMNQTGFLSPMFTEYFMWRMTDEWREKQDAKPIQPDTTLTNALNKTAWQWVDAVCATLGFPTKGRRQAKATRITEYLHDPAHLQLVVDKMKIEERLVLKRVLDAGGWVKYAALVAEFGNQEPDGMFWNEKPPVSTLGHVRTRGLLFVGKAKIGGRGATQVAVIPRDLRQALAQTLEKDAARMSKLGNYAWQRTGEAITRYYAENQNATCIPREWLEEFLRDAAERQRDVFGEWEDLERFDYFLVRQMIASPAHVIGFHLSEFVHGFLPHAYIGEFWLPAKRRMLKTIAAFYTFLADHHHIEPQTAEGVANAVKRITAGKGKLGYIAPPPPLGGEVILTAKSDQETALLTYNDRWLTLVCVTEFKGNWDDCQRAARNVTDGETKTRMIERLVLFSPPIWNSLARDADKDEVEYAREWFHHHPVAQMSAW